MFLLNLRQVSRYMGVLREARTEVKYLLQPRSHMVSVEPRKWLFRFICAGPAPLWVISDGFGCGVHIGSFE